MTAHDSAERGCKRHMLGTCASRHPQWALRSQDFQTLLGAHASRHHSVWLPEVQGAGDDLGAAQLVECRVCHGLHEEGGHGMGAGAPFETCVLRVCLMEIIGSLLQSF